MAPLGSAVQFWKLFIYTGKRGSHTVLIKRVFHYCYPYVQLTSKCRHIETKSEIFKKTCTLLLTSHNKERRESSTNNDIYKCLETLLTIIDTGPSSCDASLVIRLRPLLSSWSQGLEPPDPIHQLPSGSFCRRPLSI